MKRRTWILGAGGAGAALAGVAWHQRRAPAGEPSPPGLWQLRLARPEGGELDFASLRGAPLLLNFWATWCPPCIKEMPELDQFQREYTGRGWRVVGVAVDNPGAVREFLKKAPVGYAIALAGFDGSQISRELGNDKGGLPFTVVIDRAGALRQRRAGQTHLAELKTWAASL